VDLSRGNRCAGGTCWVVWLISNFTLCVQESRRWRPLIHVVQRTVRVDRMNCPLVELVCQEGSPLRWVETEAFRAFVRELDPRYVLPTRQSLSHKLIPAKYEETKTETMNTADCVSVTTDRWTSSVNQAYTGRLVISSASTTKQPHGRVDHRGSWLQHQSTRCHQQLCQCNKSHKSAVHRDMATIHFSCASMWLSYQRSSRRHGPSWATSGTVLQQLRSCWK